MWLFTSQFLADSNKSFFECSIIFQYLSLLFLIFIFFSSSFFYFARYNTHSTIQLQFNFITTRIRLLDFNPKHHTKNIHQTVNNVSK